MENYGVAVGDRLNYTSSTANAVPLPLKGKA